MVIIYIFYNHCKHIVLAVRCANRRRNGRKNYCTRVNIIRTRAAMVCVCVCVSAHTFLKSRVCVHVEIRTARLLSSGNTKAGWRLMRYKHATAIQTIIVSSEASCQPAKSRSVCCTAYARLQHRGQKKPKTRYVTGCRVYRGALFVYRLLKYVCVCRPVRVFLLIRFG